MSHLSLKRKRNSYATSIRSRVATQSVVPEQQKQNFNFDQNIDQNLHSIKDTVQLLKQYEKICIQKQDFLMAEQTKNKIEFLQSQQKVMQKQRGILKQKETIQIAYKEGEEEIQNFQAYWDDTIKNLIKELKQIQSNFVNQQQRNLKEFKEKILWEQTPKIKYSSKVLDLRKNLSNMIKTRKYKEADEIKNRLKIMQAEEEQIWELKKQERIKVMIEKWEKKQFSQLKALKAKLETVLNEKIKQRDQKFQILLKRNRKRQIQSSKSRINKMRDSVGLRSRSQSRVVLSNSKISAFNSSTKC